MLVSAFATPCRLSSSVLVTIVFCVRQRYIPIHVLHRVLYYRGAADNKGVTPYLVINKSNKAELQVST